MQRIILLRKEWKKINSQRPGIIRKLSRYLLIEVCKLCLLWEESNLGLPSFPAKICVYGSRGIRIVKCLVRPRMQLKLPNVV